MKIYAAFYKYKRPITDLQSLWYWIADESIRYFTKGIYSHCEIAVEQEDGTYICYSSSFREKGVRKKVIDILDTTHWDLIDVSDKLTTEAIETLYESTVGMKYDLIGAIGVVLRLKDRKNKYFCSEWCAEVLGYTRPFDVSPNDLHELLTIDSK